MSVDKQLEQLLAGPLEGLASFSSSTTAEGQPHLHSARLLRLLLDRLHQVTNEAGKDPQSLHLRALTILLTLIPPRPPAALMKLFLQDNSSALENVLEKSAYDTCSGSCPPILLDPTTSWRFVGETESIAPWDLANLPKEALTTLVDLVAGHQGNAACVLGLTALCHSVFTAGLPSCGDFGIQADIIDLLYRCAKHGSVPESYLAAFSTQAQDTFRLSLSKTFPTEAPEYFDAELCKHAHAVNLHAGSFSSVAYIEGRVNFVLLQPGPHKGFYIGTKCISFHALRAGPDPQQVLVSIPLAELENLFCTLSHAKSQLVLSATLKEAHSILGCIFQNPEQRTCDLTLTFARRYALKVTTVATQLHRAIASAVASAEEAPEQPQQEPPQPPARQKVSWGIPAYVPLDMQPSRSAATNRSRLALQPVRHEPPAGQNETQADPIIDSGFDAGPALPIQMEVEKAAAGAQAAIFNDDTELQCGQKDPLWASDGDDFLDPLTMLPDAARTSDDFLVMPSLTTAAEAGQRSPTPDITSQPRSPMAGLQNLSLLEKLMTIEEAPDEQLQAPGQLSDADEPEPWMPTAGKRKAARRINFGNHQPPANGDQDRQEEAAEPASGDDPADLQADDPAPANKKGRQSTAVRDTRNPEQGQPISKLPSDSKHAPSGLAKQSKDAVQHAQQLCLTGDKAAGRAETVRISATAHRHLKEAAQEGQGYEGPSDGDAGGIDPQKSKRRSSRKPGTATHQDSQAAAGRHAGANQRHADADQRDRQEVLNQFNATADEGSQHTPARDKRAQPKKAPQVNTAAAMGGLQTSSRPNRTPTRLANQWDKPASSRKAPKTAPNPEAARERDAAPEGASDHAPARTHPEHTSGQADSRPQGRPDPRPPLDNQAGHPNLPRGRLAASADNGEASNVSSSDRSDGFTQALQKLQAGLRCAAALTRLLMLFHVCVKQQEANTAHLQQMATACKAAPVEGSLMPRQQPHEAPARHHELHTGERPGPAAATKRKATTAHDVHGAQQQAEKEQSRAQNDDAAHTAMPDDTGMNEALEEPATATAARAKQKAKPAKPAKKAPAKKSPTKRAAPKAKQSKAAKAAEPAAAKRAQDGKRRAQTRAQKAAVTRKPSPQPSADPEADDHDDPSMPLPPLNMQPQVTRPRQEEAVSEPDIVLEVEKENVGFKLPSGTAMRCLLQPSTVSSSQGDSLAVPEQLQAKKPQAALTSLPDLPFIQTGQQQAAGLQLPMMPNPAARATIGAPGTRLQQNLPGTGLLRGRAKKQPARTETDDEEEEEEEEAAGLTLRALAQIASAAPGASSGMDSDDDDCMEEVQHVLKRIMSQKKATSRKKIAKLEQEAEAQISALVGACAAAIQKEEKAAQAALTKVASQHEAKMGQCEQRMQDAHAAYQAVVAAEWAELQKTVSSHAVVLQEAQAAHARRQAGQKRKLAEVDQQAAGILAETEAKVKRMRKKAGKMSGLAKILQPFALGKGLPSS